MRVNELRLGNYVDFDGLSFTIKCISNNFIEADRGRGKVRFSINDLKPIPITEQWLLRLGFEKEKEQDKLLATYFYHKNNISRVEFSDKHGNLYWHDNYSSIYHKEIKYVHQLQNIYFALIGEELEIK